MQVPAAAGNGSSTFSSLRSPCRSISYLLALARGCWVVSHIYVTACMEAGCWLPEKGYEAQVAAQATVQHAAGIAALDGGQDLSQSRLATCKAAPLLLQGTEDGLEAPRRARERHASGGPGLFSGQRVILTGKNRSQIAARVHHAAQQVVEAEGGLVMQGKGAGAAHGEASTRRSPSPQCLPVLVYVAPRSEDAMAALKHAAVSAPPSVSPLCARGAIPPHDRWRIAPLQRRYPGTPALHHNWVLDSVARGVLLDPEGYRITSQCPIPGGGKNGGCTQGA